MDNRTAEGKGSSRRRAVRYLTSQKRFSESNSETASIKSEESESTINDGNQNSEQISDGNQNKKDSTPKGEVNVDVTTFRNVIDELKEMYNEFLIQVKLMESDLICASKENESIKKVG